MKSKKIPLTLKIGGYSPITPLHPFKDLYLLHNNQFFFLSSFSELF